MRMYRHVGKAEYADILACGRLRAGVNSCGPGKWLAYTEADARRWGEALDEDVLSARVASVEVDDEIAERAHMVDNLDGIGRAAYVEEADLVRIRIVELRGYEP